MIQICGIAVTSYAIDCVSPDHQIELVSSFPELFPIVHQLPRVPSSVYQQDNSSQQLDPTESELD